VNVENRESFAAQAELILQQSGFLSRHTRHGNLSCFHVQVAQPPLRIGKRIESDITNHLLFANIRTGGKLLQFRGVNSGRIEEIVKHGIGAGSVNGVFWATTDVTKALEYGGEYPIVLVLDDLKIEPSWRVIYPDVPNHDAKLEAAREHFGQQGHYDSDSGQWLFSFLPLSDRGRLTGYEFAYGFRCKDQAGPPTLLMLQFEPA
jgi:hypothetical protein